MVPAAVLGEGGRGLGEGRRGLGKGGLQEGNRSRRGRTRSLLGRDRPQRWRFNQGEPGGTEAGAGRGPPSPSRRYEG